MIFNNPSDICDFYIDNVIKPGDVVIDATVGNGNDTLKLSNAVGKTGVVYGFDIQKEAIESAKQQPYKHDNLIFLNESHSCMDKHIKENVGAVFFNLGYLPGGDHSISTKCETTLPAIGKALSLLTPGGIVVLVIYRGGDSGFLESESVVNYLKTIDYKRFNVMLFDYINRPKNPPMVAVIQKKIS